MLSSKDKSIRDLHASSAGAYRFLWLMVFKGIWNPRVRIRNIRKAQPTRYWSLLEWRSLIFTCENHLTHVFWDVANKCLGDKARTCFMYDQPIRFLNISVSYAESFNRSLHSSLAVIISHIKITFPITPIPSSLSLRTIMSDDIRLLGHPLNSSDSWSLCEFRRVRGLYV